MMKNVTVIPTNGFLIKTKENVKTLCMEIVQCKAIYLTPRKNAEILAKTQEKDNIKGSPAVGLVRAPKVVPDRRGQVVQAMKTGVEDPGAAKNKDQKKRRVRAGCLVKDTGATDGHRGRADHRRRNHRSHLGQYTKNLSVERNIDQAHLAIVRAKEAVEQDQKRETAMKTVTSGLIMDNSGLALVYGKETARPSDPSSKAVKIACRNATRTRSRPASS
ncbi:uncharacterized protein LOC119459465 [Dermacentor silvarum]|uniref:uncharacterized protein LOC119459465 n=1 Tax=Dermacentor silvarum TaxID=543639 RepID=UPI00189B935F|nr:uncharacterized protein LOC119459465 [Dermacentor silvarum]